MAKYAGLKPLPDELTICQSFAKKELKFLSVGCSLCWRDTFFSDLSTKSKECAFLKLTRYVPTQVHCTCLTFLAKQNIEIQKWLNLIHVKSLLQNENCFHLIYLQLTSFNHQKISCLLSKVDFLFQQHSINLLLHNVQRVL